MTDEACKFVTGEWLEIVGPRGPIYSYPLCGRPAAAHAVKGSPVPLCVEHRSLVDEIDPQRDGMDVEVELVDDVGPVVFHRPAT